jgi:hypothetical protein
VRPAGKGVRSCNVTLMNWSPFPCRFDTNASTGVAGQQSNFCYSSGEGTQWAARLTTDGYTNTFSGYVPVDASEPCGAAGAGSRVERLLLHVDFRLAPGRQYDRTYFFQIGDVVVGGAFWYQILRLQPWRGPLCAGAPRPSHATLPSSCLSPPPLPPRPRLAPAASRRATAAATSAGRRRST